MLFCDQIHNYEDFKSRFGFKTGLDGKYLVNANGVKQRKNKIVYLYWKESAINFRRRGYSLKDAYSKASKFKDSREVFEAMLLQIFDAGVSDICPVKSFGIYKILNYGICIDGSVDSIRYCNTKTNKIYKMKIGKYVNAYLDYLDSIRGGTPFWCKNPVLRVFFVEELTELWKNKRLKEQSLHVVVDKDFEKIYSTSCREEGASNFSSCMDDDPNHHFYEQYDKLYDAVSLQDDDGKVYARAILVHCFDGDDQPHDYLERIYCNKRMYKDLMFEKAKAQGIFDLYKGLEASCHDNLEIYRVSDDTKIPYNLYIPLDLDSDCIMSYQDTFKWYYPRTGRAYNCSKPLGRLYRLDTTSYNLEIDTDD